MFGFENKKDETKKSEDGTKGVWGAQLADAVADARSSGVGRKKAAQNKSEDGGNEGGRSNLSQAAEAQVRKMFSPDSWRAIVRAPFALGKALTGRLCWEIDKTQEDTLATSTSLTAEYFLQTDPKWVALTLFAFNWSVVLTEKFAANARERMQEEKLNPKPIIPGISIVKP